jgi:hypothetical protein
MGKVFLRASGKSPLTTEECFPEDARMQLLERTQELLKKRLETHSLQRIADESEGAVDAYWLTKFASGKVADPSVNRVQRLHDHLSKRRSANKAA